MHTIDTLIIGAGHAGLAMSRCLTDRGVEHTVIERGRLGERWLSARWDSFRLLTPNWLTRLPGWSYQGADPDGFMAAPQFVDYLRAYADSFGAPVQERTTVTEVRQARSGGFVVRTDRGDWSARHVVIATGYFASARRPDCAAHLDREVMQVTPAGYRHPGQLPDGAVVVVGASASGVQIADELNRAGRRVVLAVGNHTRLPRRYRDRDILWWLDRTGALDRTIDELSDAERARQEPSMQLVGGVERLDLAALQDRGVRLAGRLGAVEGDTVRFDDDLAATTAAADARLATLVARLDNYAATLPERLPAPQRTTPVRPARGPRTLHLRHAGVSTVVWATGYRPRYPWLRVPVLDHAGRIRHRRGVAAADGLYAVGLRFQHRRNATFIDGARHDAEYLAHRIFARRTAPVRA
jgi:putative flavoprotein involved in K+ transport